MHQNGICLKKSLAVACGLAIALSMLSPLSADDKTPKDIVKVTAVAEKIDDAGKQTIAISMTIEKGWYIYANPVKNDDFKGTQTVVKVKAKKALTDVKIEYPAGKVHEDKIVGNYSTYENKVRIPVTIQRTAGDTSALEVEVIFNTCSTAGVCLRKDSYTFTLP